MRLRNVALAAARRIVPAVLALSGAVVPATAQSPSPSSAPAHAESVTLPLMPIAPPTPAAPAMVPPAPESVAPQAPPPAPAEPAAAAPAQAAAPPIAAPASDAAPAAPATPGVVMMTPIPDTSRPVKDAKPIKALVLPRAKPGSVATAPQATPAAAPQTVASAPEPQSAAAPDAAPQPAKAEAKPATVASAPPPPATPPVTIVRKAISPTARANMVQAFTAANRGDWTKARTFATLTADPVFNALVQWRYLLDAGTSAPFQEIVSFLQAHPNWPRRDALNAAAERSMPADMEPRAIVKWYGDRTPATATGKIRLGEALIATNEKQRGVALIRRGWIEGNFTPADELQVWQAHYDLLGQAEHRTKLDELLARDDIAGAKRQLARVDPEAQALANARLRIKASPATVKTVLATLPDAQRNDPELRFDAARALRQQKDDMDAASMLAGTPADAKPLAEPEERWNERHIMTRDAIKDGKYDLAYRLVSHHGLESGAGFADAEFLAGWIALRFLHKPDAAVEHFRTLAARVNLPISKARANYWLGRAQEEQHQNADAVASYRKASVSRETYYGQLALARIEDKPLLGLPDGAGKPSREEVAAFEADDRVAAIRLLGNLDDRDRMRLFGIRIASDPSDGKKLEMLAELMLSLGDPAMSVRVAKLASYSGIVLPARLAPTMALPKYIGSGNAPDSALVLGLARQESEFDPKAVSSAGARGLMQVMPASARRVAKAHGIVFKPNDLVGKPQYNVQIGMAAISDFLDQWNGSYILAIASYNAGATNVNRWVDTYGDPRDPRVDPIDWIEMIPFGETRNYVQRVLENVQIYRSRLASGHRLNILTDLYRPNAPKAAVIAFDPPQETRSTAQTERPGQASATP